MLLPTNFRTSGAYVLYKGLFVFQVGPTKEGDKLGVVRLGGRREENETAFETAKREVFEEALTEIVPFNSNKTFYLSEWTDEPKTVSIDESIAPVLMKGNEESAYSIMYLSSALTKPTPSSESKGLLLLSPKHVHRICQNTISLREYQQLNGECILKWELDSNLILQPFPQLLFLSRLLIEEPELMNQYMNTSIQH